MRKFVIGAAALGTLAFATPSQADSGLIGGLLNNICRPCGDQLDEWHRGVKDANPLYKQFEEGMSRAVRRATQQMLQDQVDRAERRNFY